MSQAGLLDVLTVLATALWALCGMVCMHAAGSSRQGREFLLGLGCLGGSALLGIDLLHQGTHALPLPAMALLAAACWAMLTPMRRDLDGAERLRLCVGAAGIGLTLHAASLLWPQQPIVAGHWRAVELPVAAALTLLALRARHLPLHTLPTLRPRLPLLLGTTAGACILMARGEARFDLFGTALLALAPLPCLWRVATARVLRTRAAVATAGTFLCVLACSQHELGTSLDHLATMQGAIAQLQRTMRATQLPLDQAVANWTWQQSRTDHAAAAAEADAAIAALRSTGVTSPSLSTIATAMARQEGFAAELFAAVEQHASADQDTLRAAAAAAATIANREAFQALASADVAFAELLLWQRRASVASADAAWLTYRGVLSLLLLLAVMATAAFVAPTPAPQPATASWSPFASTAHQLRTHLATMLGSAELLTQEPENLVDHAATIVTHGNQLAMRLDELIDLERLDHHQLSPTSQMFAIDDLCHTIVQQQLPAAESRGLGIDFALAPELPRWTHGDPLQLRRVLTALLERALLLTPIGNITLHVAAADGMLEFLVRDGGPGLDATACATFFDLPTPDANLGRSTSMVFCHRLAAAMGGTLRLASEPGHGSELTLQLPLQPAEAWEVELEHEDAQQIRAASAPSHLHGRVLLVEDARDQQLTFARLLQNAGAEVTLADNGEVALQLLQQQSFDLVLMDVQMPGMDGLTATNLLRATDSQTPVVALTADTTDANREKCLAAGCNGHLGKPVDRRTLEQTLAMYLPTSVDEVVLED